MRRAHFLAAATFGFALIGAASASHAESTTTSTPPAAHADQKGHWSLRLEMTQPTFGRDLQSRDLQAGAYYHISPSLRVGGAVSFSNAPSQIDRTDLPPQDQAPRVKLETSFKF